MDVVRVVVFAVLGAGFFFSIISIVGTSNPLVTMAIVLLSIALTVVLFGLSQARLRWG